MKILFAADGSKYTKKALAFLVTHEGLCGSQDELHVLHVQLPIAPRVKSILGSSTVAAYHKEEADKVLQPVEKFLKKHDIAFRTSWVVGHPPAEIVGAARRDKAHMVVMGTHGHGLLGRALLGSIAQRVTADCDVPVLLVK